MAGGRAWQGGRRAWWGGVRGEGACVVRGRTVRILLECILVWQNSSMTKDQTGDSQLLLKYHERDFGRFLADSNFQKPDRLQ